MRSLVLVAVAGLAAPLVAVSLSSALAQGAVPAPAAGSATSAPVTVVRTLAGDPLRISAAAGHQTLDLEPVVRAGIAGQYTTERAGGHTYVIPAAAEPYLDRTLARSLFDVATMSARVPVTATVVAGTSPAVPGLTVTSRSGSTETGYLTGSAAFGRALDAQWAKDTRAGRVAPTLFGGLAHLAVTGAVGPVEPAFQQYTLTVKAIGPDGKAVDSAFVSLTDVDDGRKFTNFLDVEGGLAKVSVPTGHYSGQAQLGTLSASGVDEEYLVQVEGVSVTAAGATMTFDARTATTVPAIHTPRPAVLSSLSLEWDRSTQYSSLSSSSSFGPGSTVHVTPTPSISYGTLDWVTTWALAETPVSGSPYTYTLSFDDSGGIPADQDRTVSAFQLATLNSRYYTDAQSRTAAFGRTAVYPFQFFILTFLNELPTPAATTDYLYAAPSTQWSASLISAATEDDPFQGFISDGNRIYQAGSTRTVDWNRGLLAPGLPEATPGTGFFFCGDCRDKTSMGLFFAPFLDSTAGQAGSLDVTDPSQTVARFVLMRNGTTIRNVANSSGALVTVPSSAGTYRALVYVRRGAVGLGTATSATEDVTFTSSSGAGAALPSGWLCPSQTPCTVLPLLTARVSLPTDLSGYLPLGATDVPFSVGRVQGAAASTISGVTFSVTTDGGRTYTPVPVTSLGNGRYRATVTNTASQASRGVGIRVSAKDADGGAIVQTVQDAYLVSQT